MDRGVWQVTIKKVSELGMTERLSTAQHIVKESENISEVLNFGVLIL